jgi:hypothetical protein
VRDLALEVRRVDSVVVDDAEASDSGSRQIEGGRTAEAAGADQEDAGREELQLALDADLGNEDVAAVASALLCVERRRWEAVASVREAAGEREDVFSSSSSVFAANAEREPPAQ